MTTTLDAAPAAPRRRSLAIRFVVAFLLGAGLVAGVGGGALYAYGQQYEGKVLPGVRVGGVDLSGMAPAAARQALEDAFASLAAGRVLVSGPEGELTIGYAEIGRGPDVEAMVASALAAGRHGEPVADLLAVPRTALRGVDLPPLVTYDQALLADAVGGVASTVDTTPEDATLARAEDGSFLMTASHDGRVVDQAALLDAIRARVGALDAPAEIRLDLPVAAIAPHIDTADATAARDAGERMAADIELTRDDSTWTIPGSKIRRLISFSPTVDGSIVPVVDVTGIDPLIERIAKDVNQKPKNAGFRLGSGNTVAAVVPGRVGLELDVEATRAEVVDALLARRVGDTADPALEPVVASTAPALSTKDAERYAPRMRAISRWTTYFPIYEGNGFGANIWIPAKLINGYVLAPGETFDFWKAVGTVTREKGFRSGGAIINGRTDPQGALAGGICSCSTTLFNAALRAGFDMGARRNHYYYIDRYPLGLDATVFISDGGGSTQTMSFTNDTDFPAIIRGVNTRRGSAGYVTFVIVSVPNHRKVVIGNPTVKNVRPASDSVQYTASMKKGTSKRIEYPVDGKDVWRTVSVFDSGKLLRRTTYYSHYARITGIVLVGTAGSSKPEAEPAP